MIKKGFSLLELLVVIGLLGILVAILLKSVSGSSDSARASKCLANMHTLAAACHSIGMAEDYYPLAGSREQRTRTQASRKDRRTKTFYEVPGWISWYSKGQYNGSTTGHKSGMGWFVSTYVEDLEKRTYCLTNGVLWNVMNGSASAYVCPEHVICAHKHGLEPAWSYVMNGYFGWDDTQGSGSRIESARRGFNSVKNTDRLLLFAELAFNEANTDAQVNYSSASGIEFDPTLQYGENETIGFNHKNGNKGWCAHICFADGHTEKLMMPKDTGPSSLRELTKWLCTGKDISYNGSRYDVLDNLDTK